MVRHRLKLALDRSIDHGVADHDLRAADERLIDADGGLDLLAEAPLERAFEPRKLVLRQRESAGNVRSRKALVGIPECSEEIADLRQQLDPFGADQHADEVAALRVEPIAADRQK